jgi:ABC-2 type transport system ATP-binding protein
MQTSSLSQDRLAPGVDSEPAAVVLGAVNKSFGARRAVVDLSFRVPPGAVYGIIGPNGSGKSTTLRMITRIYHPDAGQIQVLGQDATSGEAASDRIGYLPEERGLYRKMPVGELLRFFAALKGVPERRARLESRRWLERLGIGETEKRRVETLSKGMAQKVQFIAALLHEPELLILDEPFSGLDPVNMEAIREAILDLRRLGTTILFSTHDMEVAERMCDFILMIHRGRKVLDGTLDSIRQRYATDTVKIRISGGAVAFEDLPGVARVNDFGRLQELRLEPGCDPQSILRGLVGRVAVEHFEVGRPHLHDIFVRIAGANATAAQLDEGEGHA